MLFLVLAACSPSGPPSWEVDVQDDLVTEAFEGIFGSARDDAGGGELLGARQAAGTELFVVLGADGAGDASGWRVTSLNEAICEPDLGASRDDEVPVTLHFGQAGSTELYVIDSSDQVLEVQPVEVREPAGAEVWAYEAVALPAGANANPVDTLDVLPGGALTTIVAWTDVEGVSLAGVGLLTASTDDAALDVAASTALAGTPLEGFDLFVSSDEEIGSHPVGLLASDTTVRTLDVVVHDPAEVTAVEIVEALEIEEVGVSGTLRAQASAGDVPLFGVSTEWFVDGESSVTGPWVDLLADDEGHTHEITACVGEVCARTTVAATIWGAGSSLAQDSIDCGCAQGGAAGWMAVALGVPLLVVRRRTACSSG